MPWARRLSGIVKLVMDDKSDFVTLSWSLSVAVPTWIEEKDLIATVPVFLFFRDRTRTD